MSEKLTEFSKTVKAQFFESFPLLLKLENKIIENEDCAFCIEIKAPSANVEHPLSIDTYGEEVTVAFDVYHSHYNEFFGDAEYGSAFEFVNQIISDDFAVVSYWRDDRWCGSALLGKEHLPTTNEDHPYANKIKIRSWSGVLDVEISCAPRD